MTASRTTTADRSSTGVETTLLAVDLLAIAARAGLEPGEALGTVAAMLPAAFDGALTRAVAPGGDAPLARRLRREATTLGPPHDVVAFVVADALDSGEAVAVTLDAVAAELRRRRRHEVEAAARRLPVVLLIPMVCCLLPATLLVTIVPALIAGLDRIAG